MRLSDLVHLIVIFILLYPMRDIDIIIQALLLFISISSIFKYCTNLFYLLFILG